MASSKTKLSAGRTAAVGAMGHSHIINYALPAGTRGAVTGMGVTLLENAKLTAAGRQFVFGSQLELTDSIRTLTAEMALLRQSIDTMSSRFDELSNQIEALAPRENAPLRDLSDDEATAEIRKFFEEHDGETVYPSDIASELNIAYDTVSRLVETLERDGKIAKS